MPKQGQYAKSQRAIHVKSIRQRGHAQTGRVIADRNFSDFALARFALTTKKDLSPLAAETSQRFLQEFLPRLQDQQGDMAKTTQATLQYCLGRVPWQFFKLLSASWAQLMHFCQRELPAVPLNKRILVKAPVDRQQLDQMLGKLLSQQAAAITLVNTPNKALQQLMTQKLGQQILVDGEIDWQVVGKLLQPFNQSLNTAKDQGTQDWIKQLSAR